MIISLVQLLIMVLLIVLLHSTVLVAYNHRHRHHRFRHRRNELRKLPNNAHKISRQPRFSSDDQTTFWSLTCPRVIDSINVDVHTEVTWTRDGVIWLKIDNGKRKVARSLTSYTTELIGTKSITKARTNNERYAFSYNELTGDFNMQINPIIYEEDYGVWQCLVTVDRMGKTQILTSRRQVQARDEAAIATFSRTDQANIEITRSDETAHPEVVVFSRQLSSKKGKGADNMRVVIEDNEPVPRHKHSRHKGSYASDSEAMVVMDKWTIIAAVLIPISMQLWCQQIG